VTVALTIRSVRARGIDLALQRPVETASGVMRTAPLVLVDVVTEEGVVGCSYVVDYNQRLSVPDAIDRARVLDHEGLYWIEEPTRAAALADAAGLPASSHTFPELSVHLLGVTATCRYLEYLDHAGPILTEPVRVESGHALTPDRPGSGLEWNEEAVERALGA
jgi:L-alanine-DL-glutamate epimerase-like enolase superfamily enzyme